MSENLPFLPYGRQQIDDRDRAAVAAALASDYLTTGPAVEAFETALAQATDAGFAVSCSSGTAALHMAYLALGLGPGDIGIVPAITFTATASAYRLVGADVLFTDVDPKTGLMTLENLADAYEGAKKRGIADRIRAVTVVHFAGQCADLPAIATFCRDRGIHLIEDACHAIGGAHASKGKWHRVGSCVLSDLACFSFHPVKTVACGEGGAVTGNDPALCEKLADFRSHGITRNETRFKGFPVADGADGYGPWHYEMLELGLNYRLSDLHAALGASQLKRLEGFVQRRSELVARYDDLLARAGLPLEPLGRVADCHPAWHLYPVLIDFEALGQDRKTVMASLRAQGIGSQVHYIPVPWQPYYRQSDLQGSYPGAASYYARTLSLPLFVDMTDDDPKRVVEALKHTLG